ncbi:MAG: hypothetical protein AB7T20_10045 [Steroidobacteraceae bacterium]
MNLRSALFHVAIIFQIAGCSDSGTSGGQKPTPASVEPGAAVVAKADSVVVDDGSGRTHIMGAIRVALGQGGEFTGVPGPSEPAGPVTVYIFRTVPADTRQFFADSGIDVRENAAYLWPASAPYDADSFKRLQFVRAIDPALTDEALAAEFGVNVAVATPAASSD